MRTVSFRECIWKRTGRDFLGVEFGDFSMLELSSEEIGRFLYVFLLVLIQGTRTGVPLTVYYHRIYLCFLQGGPLPVTNGVISPINGLIYG